MISPWATCMPIGELRSHRPAGEFGPRPAAHAQQAARRDARATCPRPALRPSCIRAAVQNTPSLIRPRRNSSNPPLLAPVASPPSGWSGLGLLIVPCDFGDCGNWLASPARRSAHAGGKNQVLEYLWWKRAPSISGRATDAGHCGATDRRPLTVPLAVGSIRLDERDPTTFLLRAPHFARKTSRRRTPPAFQPERVVGIEGVEFSAMVARGVVGRARGPSQCLSRTFQPPGPGHQLQQPSLEC